MPKIDRVPVKDLTLDLNNYRTIPQPDEASALLAMVSASPDRFWALANSLLEDGYLPTENVLVLQLKQGRKSVRVVREGNRRIGALKLIFGLLPIGMFDDMPDETADAIKTVSKQWLNENRTVPCTIYPESEADTVDRIVALAHGKGEKASRDQWNTLARARHNRDKGASEPALDLLEKYLNKGQNLTQRQRAQWAGDYKLTVLAEAIKRLAPRLGFANAPDLAAAYPAVRSKTALENILHDVGILKIGFDEVRKDDFGVDYGFAAAPPTPPKKTSGKTGRGSAVGGSGTGGGTAGGAGAAGVSPKKPKAFATTDPRSVLSALRDFTPRGKNRDKVETLRKEAISLDVDDTPHAFCFVLRSMFELSAKAFCTDHASAGLTCTKKDGNDRALVDVLRDITSHVTNKSSDRQMTKRLHGAMTELGTPEGLLSVTSMNQLVHNPAFSVAPRDIAVTFAKIIPLLQAMNE